jgi:hypothetical protein
LREPSDDICSRQLYAAFVVDDRQLGGFSFSVQGKEFQQLETQLIELVPGLDLLTYLGTGQRVGTGTVAVLAGRARAKVEALLLSYQPPRESRGWMRELEWDGRTLQLDFRLEDHHELARAVDNARVFTTASSEGAELELITNIGVKYRDFHVLAWLRSRAEFRSETIIVRQWAERIGGSAAVTASLDRLVACGCITRDAGYFSPTLKGLRIDGPEEYVP